MTQFDSSLCNLMCPLYLCGWTDSEKDHHGDTENVEVAQRNRN